MQHGALKYRTDLFLTNQELKIKLLELLNTTTKHFVFRRSFESHPLFLLVSK
jgi:hypothetical protein